MTTEKKSAKKTTTKKPSKAAAKRRAHMSSLKRRWIARDWTTMAESFVVAQLRAGAGADASTEKLKHIAWIANELADLVAAGARDRFPGIE